MRTVDSADEVALIQQRVLDDADYLVIYMDWVVTSNHSFLVALGVDSEGNRRIVGVCYGNARSVKTVQTLLDDLVHRKLKIDRRRLYVVASSMILRNSVLGMFGDAALIQRCRTHCLNNVTGPLSDDLGASIKKRLKSAFSAPWQRARAEIEIMATDIRDENPIVAANLLESLNEDLTINRFDLPPALTRELATTRFLLSPEKGFKHRLKVLNRLKIETEATACFADLLIEVEEKFSRIPGFRDLWILDTALKQENIDESYGEDISEPMTKVASFSRAQHRRHKRWNVHHVEGQIQCTIRANVMDISLNGVAVETRSPLAVGRSYTFNLANADKKVDLIGRVAWCKLNRTERVSADEIAAIYRAGIEFDGTLSSAGDNLLSFLENSVEILLDRRIFGRFKVVDGERPIQLNSAFPFVVKKISASGMLIETEFQPELQTILPIEVKLGTKTFEASGKVIHTHEKPNSDLFELGIEFIECEKESNLILESFISNELDSVAISD